MYKRYTDVEFIDCTEDDRADSEIAAINNLAAAITLLTLTLGAKNAGTKH